MQRRSGTEQYELILILPGQPGENPARWGASMSWASALPGSVPIESPRIYSYALKTKVAHITGGLGCPNGCDFCCTSHFFKRKYIPFVKSGQELYTIMLDMEKEAKKAGDVLSGFILIDEDFFLHEKRAREFLKSVREGGKPLSIMGFGSVRGLSKFTPDEIAEMGFDLLWTAFEGTESNFSKLKGKSLLELYSSRKSHGVALLSSMISDSPIRTGQRSWRSSG